MKEITLKEWSAMLPTWVMCEVTDMGEKKISKLCGLHDCGELVFHNIVESHQGFEMVKPILRDLSDLTKEIEHNGEKFVPIDKISIYANNDIYLIEQINTGMVEKIVFDMLISWHFNVYQISDDLIIKVDDKFNPYK